jgi:hypothetical protein
VATRSRSVLVLAGLLCVLVGCADDTATEPEPDVCDPWDDYLALQVGDWWEFQRVEWEEQVPDNEYDYTRTVVAEDTLLAGSIAYRVFDDSGGETNWLVFPGCELRLYEEHPDSTSEYTIPLKRPFSEGRTWQYYQVSVGGIALYAEIVSTAETKVVPAGTFENCIHVRVEPYYDLWCAAGVGIIAAEMTGIGGTYGTTDELVDYGVGPIPR